MPKEKKDDKYVTLTSETEGMGPDGSMTTNKNDVSVNATTGDTLSLVNGKVVKGNVGVSDQVNNDNIAKQPPPRSQANGPVATSNQQSGLQGQSNNEAVKNNELEKQYRGNFRPFNDILDNPDLTAQAKLSAIRRIENSHNK